MERDTTEDLSEIDDLIERAANLHGPLYANLLRIDHLLSERERAGQHVPQSWRAKRRRLGREYDRELARFERDLERARGEFWRG